MLCLEILTRDLSYGWSPSNDLRSFCWGPTEINDVWMNEWIDLWICTVHLYCNGEITFFPSACALYDHIQVKVIYHSLDRKTLRLTSSCWHVWQILSYHWSTPLSVYNIFVEKLLRIEAKLHLYHRENMFS